jgi:hypothetical protein
LGIVAGLGLMAKEASIVVTAAHKFDRYNVQRTAVVSATTACIDRYAADEMIRLGLLNGLHASSFENLFFKILTLSDSAMSFCELNGVVICPLIGASNFSLRNREVCLDNISNTNKRNCRNRHTECRAAFATSSSKKQGTPHVPQPMRPGARFPSRTGVALRAIRR